MNASRIRTALLFGLIFLPISISLASDEKTIELGSVPAAVRAAADRASTSTRWTTATREEDNGQSIYELKGRDSVGRDVEVEVGVDANGVANVLKFETKTPQGQIPSLVADPTPRPDAGSVALGSTEKVRPKGKEASGSRSLWPYGVGALLVIVGLVVRSIAEEYVRSIGSVIAKKLGSDRVGEALERRLSTKTARPSTDSALGDAPDVPAPAEAVEDYP